MAKTLDNSNDLFGKAQKRNNQTMIVSENDRASVDVVNKARNKAKDIAIIGVTVVLGAVLLYVLFSTMWNSDEEEEVKVALTTSDIEQYNNDATARDAVGQYRDSIQDFTASIEEESQETDDSAVSSTPTVDVTVHKVEPTNFTHTVDSDILKRKYGGMTLLDEQAILYEKKDQQAQNNEAPELYKSKYMEDGDGRSEDDSLTGSDFADGRASVIKIPQDFLLPSGSALSCVLKTKIVTSYKGLVLCQLSKDIYSANGKNLLVRKGAMLEGVQNEAVIKGATRIFTTWTNIRDGGVSVRIDALGTDTLGASGLPAWVDNHFWDTFGQAMLLSFYADAVKTGFSHLKKDNSGDETFSSSNMEDSATAMVDNALQQAGIIAPTGVINQGTLVNILVPRNIDFSKVYKNIVNYR